MPLKTLNARHHHRKQLSQQSLKWTAHESKKKQNNPLNIDKGIYSKSSSGRFHTAKSQYRMSTCKAAYYDNQDKWVNLKWLTGISFSKVTIKLTIFPWTDFKHEPGNQLEETAGETRADKKRLLPQAGKSVMVRRCDRVRQKFIDVSCETVIFDILSKN